MDIFSPIQEDYSNLLNQRKPTNLENNINTFEELFSTATKKLIRDLIKSVVDNEIDIEVNRRKISENTLRNEQDLMEIFNLLDFDQSKLLTKKKVIFKIF